jgi:hypothetical protein
MNPVTTMLLEQLDWPEFETWVDCWDRLEQTLMMVYRSGLVSDDQQREYRALRKTLLSSYRTWRSELKVYWRATRVAGKQLDEDPFMALTASKRLSVEDVDWGTVQMLPAAREALNSFLLDAVNRRKDAN